MKIRCPRCEGDGWIVHPLWKRYWREHREYREEECKKWFGGNPPPEEIVCPLCKGDGDLSVIIITSIRGVKIIPLI